MRAKGPKLPVGRSQTIDGVIVLPGIKAAGARHAPPAGLGDHRHQVSDIKNHPPPPTRASQTKKYYSPRRRKSGCGGGKRIVDPSNSPRTKPTPETTAKRLELMQKRSKVH